MNANGRSAGRSSKLFSTLAHMKKILAVFYIVLISGCSSTQISQTIGEVNKAMDLRAAIDNE
jgi:hypothetical protein